MKSNPKKNPQSKTEATDKATDKALDSDLNNLSAIHKIELTVTNNIGEDLIPKPMYNWFDSGGMKTPQSSILNGYASTVSFQENDYLKGCSGYIVYAGIQTGNLLFIAFSNPAIGKNKLGVDDLYPTTDTTEISAHGDNLWGGMSDHSYDPFTEDLFYFKHAKAECQCSGGKTNEAKVHLIRS
jgi:hypothetical protein